MKKDLMENGTEILSTENKDKVFIEKRFIRTLIKTIGIKFI